MFLDKFSTLDDLTKKQRKDPAAVLAALSKRRQFSTFEVDSDLANTLSILLDRGWIQYGKSEYPWHRVIITKEWKELRG